MSIIQPNSYEPYVFATNEQLDRHVEALGEIVSLMDERDLTFNERSACERHIQVIVEMAIGVSKHCLKKNDRSVPAESRLAIQDAYEVASVSGVQLANLLGAVGMRNVIVHDYLNVSWVEIAAVLKSRAYLEVHKYVKVMGANLLK